MGALGGAGDGGKRERAASSIESFADSQKVYKDLASAAMQRVRMRLLGYEDGNAAAVSYSHDLKNHGLLSWAPSQRNLICFLEDQYTAQS